MSGRSIEEQIEKSAWSVTSQCEEHLGLKKVLNFISWNLLRPNTCFPTKTTWFHFCHCMLAQIFFPCSTKLSFIFIIWDWVYPRKWGWPDLPHSNSILSNSYSPFRSTHGILLQTNALVSSTSSLVILTSSCPSFQTPMLFSKHAHHPSLTLFGIQYRPS